MTGGRTVLVTGATGLVGRRLVERLMAAPHRVRALVRHGTPADDLAQAGIEIVRGDLSDPDSLRRAAEGCDCVYHLAALVSRRRRSRRELETTNVTGAANMAVAAAGARRLVHVSTCGVYGARNRVPTDEAAPIVPDTPYRISKARGERAARTAAERVGLPIVIARITSVIGPGAASWLPLCRSLRAGDFRMIGTGRNRRHFAHVIDVVDGLVRCAETPGIAGRCYNLAGPDPITMRKLVAVLSDELGVVPRKRSWPAAPFRLTRWIDLANARWLGVQPRRLHSYDLFLADHWYDISRAQGELGYAPRISAAESLRELARASMATPTPGSHRGRD